MQMLYCFKTHIKEMKYTKDKEMPQYKGRAGWSVHMVAINQGGAYGRMDFY